MDSANNPIVARYIQKPIEACLLTKDNLGAVAEWCGGELYSKDDAPIEEGAFNVESGKRKITADIGDYIVKTAKGDFFKVTGDTFKLLYEQIWWEEPTDE